MGPANPAWKDGRYSKLLTGVFGEHYRDAEADKKLMSLRSAIALCEAHIQDVLGMIERGEVKPVQAWPELERYIEQGRKLRDSEMKTASLVQKMVTADEVRRFAAQVVMILHEEEKDRDVLQRVAQKIRALQVTGQGGTVEASDSGAD